MDLSLNLDKSSASYGDLLMVSGSLVLTSDVDARGTDPVLQSILQRLRFFSGEWFLNKGLGVPYYQQILVRSPNLGAIDVLLQNTILATPGVAGMTRYTSSLGRAYRVLSVGFTVARVRGGTVSWDGELNTATSQVVQ